MTIPIESIAPQPLPLLHEDHSCSQEALSSFDLMIQDKMIPLILSRRPYPHLSHNPLGGNSLY